MFLCGGLALVSNVVFLHIKKTEIKKNLREFSGFAFKRDSEEFKKKKAALDKWVGTSQLWDQTDTCLSLSSQADKVRSADLPRGAGFASQWVKGRAD